MKMDALVECVPNFSEGRNSEVIDAISKAITSTKGCYLLDVDPGKSTNRTVYTFVGSPENVLNGAMAGAKVAYKLINMETHKGSHPRIGALDVCPFIPIKNISIEECVELSKRFGQMLASELNVPVFLYGESQPLSYRRELGDIRAGDYEKLKEKLESDERMKPDYGPAKFVSTYGATCVGARNFLIAYNVNVLGTKEQAHRIALNVREQGRSANEPGRCKKLKAIGWWLEESNMAQVSINLTDYKVTNIHQAFEECDKDARELKLSTCGTQIVGLIPLDAILRAADYYIKKEELLLLEEDQKVKLVIQRLGLSSLGQFDPKERIIEYLIEERLGKDGSDEVSYKSMSLKQFTSLVGARSSLPGGGCVAALTASLGSSLACMCALLTYGNKKFEKLDAQIRELLPDLYNAYNELIEYVDEDAKAFNSFVSARRLPPGSTEQQKKEKEDKIRKGLINCIDVPFTVATKAFKLWPVFAKLAPLFNMEAKSDLLVAVKCLETGIYGAYENVLINASSSSSSSSDKNNNNNSNGEKMDDAVLNKYKQDIEIIWRDTQIHAKQVFDLIQARS